MWILTTLVKKYIELFYVLTQLLRYGAKFVLQFLYFVLHCLGYLPRLEEGIGGGAKFAVDCIVHHKLY